MAIIFVIALLEYLNLRAHVSSIDIYLRFACVYINAVANPCSLAANHSVLVRAMYILKLYKDLVY